MWPFLRTVCDTDEIRHASSPCGTKIGICVTNHQCLFRLHGMRRDAMQQPVRLWLAAMAAISPDHRIEQLQNAKLFQTVARGFFAVIGEECDPEPGRSQTA